MEEMHDKEIGQIRFEFTDGSWFVLDEMKLRHLDTQTRTELNIAISKTFEEIEHKRIQSEAENILRSPDIGISTQDGIGTRDVGPGQN